MYRTALTAIARAFPVMLALAVLGMLAEYIANRNLRAGAAFAIYGTVALYAHRASILGERFGLRHLVSRTAPSGSPLPFAAFLVRSVLFILALVGLIWGMGYSAVVLSGVTGRMAPAMVVVGMLAAVLVHGIMLSYIGTLLPAVAVGGDGSLRAAWARGQTGFGATLRRLTFGPFVFTVLCVILFAGIEEYLGPAEGIRLAGQRFLAACLAIFSTALAAAALGRSYEEAEAG